MPSAFLAFLVFSSAFQICHWEGNKEIRGGFQDGQIEAQKSCDTALCISFFAPGLGRDLTRLGPFQASIVLYQLQILLLPGIVLSQDQGGSRS